jgi:hypothetical protein
MTTMGKLYIHLVKRGDKEFEIAGLSEDKSSWFELPSEYRNLKEHKELLKNSTIKMAANAIKPIDGYRKVGIKLDEELKGIYFDEGDNLCFKKLPLEEVVGVVDMESSIIRRPEEEFLLMKRIKELELKLDSREEVKLHQIEKRFILEKFDKKPNAADWIERYEAECIRHGVNNDIKRIEALRFFLEGSPSDWYEANLRKIGLRDWVAWKKAFLLVFVEKGWSAVRKAFQYKFLGGSLVDYALTKEKLCLEAESTGTIVSRINMIVFGCPMEVQNELDREEIQTIEKLFTELRKLDESFNRKRKDTSVISGNKRPDNGKPKDKPEDQKKRNDLILRKPCYMCEALGWRNRYHPTTECRNQAAYSAKIKVNLTEADEETNNDAADIMRIELDNKSLN